MATRTDTYSTMDQFKKHQALYEIFDAQSVQWILANKQTAFRMLPPHRQHIKTTLDKTPSHYVKGWSETMADLQEMLIMSEPTDDTRYRKIDITYKQLGGQGRRYAREAGALATTQREIRQAIAHPSLRDYDMCNCHFTILHWLCTKPGGLGVKCPLLTKYVKHRADVLAAFKDPARGKTVLLSLLNSDNPNGTAVYRGVDPDTVAMYERTKDKKILKKMKSNANQVMRKLKPFIAEMIRIQHAFVDRYPNEYLEHEQRRKTRNKDYNLRGSFVNNFLIESEGRLLDVIYNAIGRPRHCSLQYDGVMVDCVVDCHGVMAQLKREFGIDMVLREKPRKEALAIPTHIPAFSQPRYSFDKLLCHAYNTTLRDGRYGISMRDAIAITKKTIACMANGKGSIGQIKWTLVTSSQGERSWWRRDWVFVATDKFMRKCAFSAHIFNPKYGAVDDKGKAYPRYIAGRNGPLTFAEIVTNLRNSHGLPAFTGDTFVPNAPPVIGMQLNLYTPPRWSKVPPIDITAEKGHATIWNMICHLCGDNQGEALHLLAHIADMVKHPELLRRNAHAFISRQGCGKGLLFWFMSRLIGETNTSIESDAGKYFTADFNKLGSDSILRCFEELNMGVCEKYNNRIKEEITRSETVVKQKYFDACSHTNFARVWVFSNHKGSLYVEDSEERRWTLHLATSGAHVNNPDFFGPIIANIKDDEYIAGVYNWLKQYEYTEKQVSTVFVNAFKSTVQFRSEPKALTFLKWVCLEHIDLKGPLYILRGGPDFVSVGNVCYLKGLIKLFEDDKGVQRTSTKAIDSRLLDYGFEKTRGIVPGGDSRVRHTVVDLDRLVLSIERDTKAPMTEWARHM